MSKLADERELLSKPGDTILETIEFIRMSQAELAERMGKTPAKINDLISGKGPLTFNTALQLEKVLGIDMQFWLNREIGYRKKLTQIEEEESLEQYMIWLKEQPIKELKKSGYIKTEKKGMVMVNEMLQFYGVASPKQWEAIYIKTYASTSFLRSNIIGKTVLSNMAAWLRIGELKLQKIRLPEFNKAKFKKSLQTIKDMISTHPDDFAIKVQQLCYRAGVAVIYLPILPKAPVSGATRWIGGQPVIQITDRHSTNDQFWFTLFHEAGHILLHGRKDVFIEEFEGIQNDLLKEEEANDFANNWLLPISFADEIPIQITKNAIIEMALKYKTHTAIVLKRLEDLKLVPINFGTELKLTINLPY